jgi:hypothetical protein
MSSAWKSWNPNCYRRPMEDKRFQEKVPEADRLSQRMDKILSEMEYLVELEEELLRRQFEPFRIYLPSDSSRRR